MSKHTPGRYWYQERRKLLFVRNGERAGDLWGSYNHSEAVAQAVDLLGDDLLRVSDEHDCWVAYYRSNLPAIAKAEGAGG